MEIRELRYFLEVAREENMTKAAQRIHVTQPTLSKALRALEDELGKKLFTRHSFKIELTDEGMLLRKRAEDLVSMADKISMEFRSMDDIAGGEIYFGLAESYQIRFLAKEIRGFKKVYPNFRYHVTSGDTEQVTEKLDKGILDFAVIVEEPDIKKYDYFKLNDADTFGLVMPSDCELAQKESVEIDDLIGLPLFCSDQSWNKDLPRWCGDRMAELSLEGSFRLSYNASVFAKEKLGYLLTFDHLVNTSDDSGLSFRPLKPMLECPMYIIWKKQQMFSPIAGRFFDQLKSSLEMHEGSDD